MHVEKAAATPDTQSAPKKHTWKKNITINTQMIEAEHSRRRVKPFAEEEPCVAQEGVARAAHSPLKLVKDCSSTALSLATRNQRDRESTADCSRKRVKS